MILKTSETIKKYFAELGKEGNIMFMRYKELLKGVDKIEEDVLKDYSKIPVKKGLTILSNLTFDGLLDLESIARLVLGDSIDTETSPKGYRFLKNTQLAEKETAQIVKQFGSLNKILESKPEEFEEILKNRAETTYQELRKLREQVLSGKLIT
jgi:DNA integrity scanning protein DisA with diadenylate cyclase activity